MKIWILIAIFNQGHPHETIYIDPWVYRSLQECDNAVTAIYKRSENDSLSDAVCRSVEFKSKNKFESPMPVLESVDEVLLTPEEELKQQQLAKEKNKYTKLPSRPLTQKDN